MKDTRAKEKKTFKTKRDNYARKLKKKKLINYLGNELRSCSTHGLPYIVEKNTHWFETAFWTTSFVCCLGLASSLLLTQYTRYVNTPIVMSVEKDYFNWNISYPAITLCPLEKIDEDDLNTLVNETLDSVGVDINLQLRTIASISLETIDFLSAQFTNTSEKIIYPKDYMEIITAIGKKINNNSINTNTNWPISVESSMTEMGMCHVINSNVAIFDNPDLRRNDDIKYVKKNIDLSIYDRDFFSQISNYADVYKVYIHHPNEIVLSTTPSYTINLEGFTYLGVQVRSTRASNKLRNIPLTYRNCRFLDEPISKRYPIYSYNHCILECRIQMILKLCNCLPHFYKYMILTCLFSLPCTDYEKICDLYELKCIILYKMEIIKLSTSENTWNKFVNKQGLPRSPRDCGCVDSCEKDVYLKEQEIYISQGDKRLRIGVSSFPKVRVVREIIFSVYDMILRSGGVINLCLGTSIISLMELLIIAIKLLCLLVIQHIKCIIN
ncbi:sodium channel protein Nach-like [Galleria mellonella]|uniref:Sodium channel protein Nach-like n=1 Tax=Galleria mellonella TaxID=7137 RepID=A0ABM3MLX4_GALME|nr:sodium channel protein Nach-like [Galleria mellonella]